MDLAGFLKDVKMGEPFFLRNVLFVPLKGPSWVDDDFIVLDEGVERGWVRIRETGDIGSSFIENQGPGPLFLMDGEELYGARQNRILNTSMVIERERKVKVPVSCVEQGRWSGGGSFSSGRICAHPGLRAITASSVHRSLRTKGKFESNQSGIWKEIDRKSRTFRVISRTSSMHEIMEKTMGEDLFRVEYEPGEDEIGIMGYAGKKPLAIDIFGSHSLYRKLAPKILSSYLFDGMEFGGEEPEVDGFFSRLLEIKDWERFRGVDVGEEWRYTGKKQVAKALVVNEKPVHVAFFAM
ncbi:hypothetical protein DRQ16_01390 [bacterium]|nr:MAG: hypothetical protein DRQ16_01390 [bacterium]